MSNTALANWIYVYKIVGDRIVLEKSFGRGAFGLKSAKEKVKGLEASNVESFYTIGKKFSATDL